MTVERELAHLMADSRFDRVAHRRTDELWLAQAWLRGRVVLLGPDGRALLRGDHVADLITPAFTGAPAALPDVPPRLVLLEAREAPEGERYFLGVDSDDVPYFAVCAELPAVSDTSPAHLWQVGHLMTPADRTLLTCAVALFQWHRAYAYSPATGAPTEAVHGGWVRRGPDGELVFPRTDPAVIVAVSDDVPGPEGRLLLGRNVMWRPPGAPRYSVLAGFVEPGETAEEAVAREVREEVNVAVDRIVYVASQSYPYPRSLMLGYTAVGDPSAPVRTDPEEIVDARWFTRREIEAILDGRDTSITLPNPSSIARQLVMGWLEG